MTKIMATKIVTSHKYSALSQKSSIQKISIPLLPASHLASSPDYLGTFPLIFPELYEVSIEGYGQFFHLEKAEQENPLDVCLILREEHVGTMPSPYLVQQEMIGL